MRISANRWAGAAVAAFALALILHVIPNHSSATDYGWMRPRTLPTICAVLLLGLGLLHAARPTGAVSLETRAMVRAGLVALACAVAVWTMSRLGFLVTAPALALALMLFIGERRPLWLLAGAAGAPALIWVVAEGVLSRPLP